MRVAVAIILDEEGRVLVTQRPHHTSHGGYWEFPGGKLEEQESAEQAIIREIKEEIGLEVIESNFLGEVIHQYPDKTLHLLVFHIKQFLGKPSCLEGQLNMQWLKKNELKMSDFPEANHKILDLNWG